MGASIRSCIRFHTGCCDSSAVHFAKGSMQNSFSICEFRSGAI